MRAGTGGQLCWTEEGNGPTLVALHGAVSMGAFFRPLAATMPYRHMVMPDLPGHGESDPWETDFHGEAGTAISHLVDGFEHPVDLLGHGLGATIALQVALDRPGRIRSLTLIEPLLFAAAPRPMRARQAEMDAPQLAALDSGDPEGAARLYFASWGDGRDWKDLPRAQRDYITMRIALLPNTAPALQDDANDLLAPDRLEAFSAPVLLIEGTETKRIIGFIQDGLAGRFPNASRVVVPGAGHNLPATHSDAIALELSRLKVAA